MQAIKKYFMKKLLEKENEPDSNDELNSTIDPLKQ